MNQKKIVDNISSIIYLLSRNGCSIESVQLFIQHIFNNIDDIILESTSISNHVFFLYNHKKLYGLILSYLNNTECYRYIDGHFKEVNHLDNWYDDYVFNLILNSKNITNLSYFSSESHLNKLKKVKLNSFGYHLK